MIGEFQKLFIQFRLKYFVLLFFMLTIIYEKITPTKKKISFINPLNEIKTFVVFVEE